MKALVLDLPADALSYWKVDDAGRVRWLSRDEGIARGFTKRKLAKLHPDVEGKPAGYQPVYGRGFIVMCSRRRILTCDIAAALHLGHWPWEKRVAIEHEPPCRETTMHLRAVAARLEAPVGADDSTAAAIARYWWRIDQDGKLVWCHAPHETRPAGSPAAGVDLLGGRTVVTTSGFGFLVDDIRALLYAGRWPWEGIEHTPRKPISAPEPVADDMQARINAFKARQQTADDWD